MENYKRLPAGQRAFVIITAKNGSTSSLSCVRYEVYKMRGGRRSIGTWIDKAGSMEFRSRYEGAVRNVREAAEALGYRTQMGHLNILDRRDT